MKADSWQPNQRVSIAQAGRNFNTSDDRRKAKGTTTDRPPEKIDGLIRAEIKLDDGRIVFRPVQLIQPENSPSQQQHDRSN